MAEMPKTVKLHVEFDEDTLAVIRQIVRDELAVFGGIVTSAAVHRRDGTKP